MTDPATDRPAAPSEPADPATDRPTAPSEPADPATDRPTATSEPADHATDRPAAPSEPADHAIDPELRSRALDGIIQLLPRVLKRELPEVTENACLFDEVGLTSAATLELILELEDHLDVQIDVEGIDQDDLRSVGTLAGFIAGHVIAED
ncbi:phosphopantetheine-binding protein [Kitasatospora sp. NPDC004614]|uniref:acyl carrier protein n=1 Tax=unclassified Kitasatospora TaxID=2633591 RepID=UPI0036AF1D18